MVLRTPRTPSNGARVHPAVTVTVLFFLVLLTTALVLLLQPEGPGGPADGRWGKGRAPSGTRPPKAPRTPAGGAAARERAHLPPTSTSASNATRGPGIEPESGGAIRGVVLERYTRRPVAGATVRVVPRREGPRPPRRAAAYEVETDEKGAFAVKGVPPGAWDVEVRCADFRPGLEKGLFVERGRVTGPVEILLRRGAEVHGHVYVEGTGRPGVRLELAGPGGKTFRSKSGENGFYRFSGLAPGIFRVEAWLEEKGSRRSVSERILLEEGASETLDILFPAGTFIAGRVTRSGKPAAGVAVWAEHRPGSEPGEAPGRETGGLSWSGEDGTYRIPGLLPGRYTLLANEPRGENVHTVKKEVVLEPGGTACDIELEEENLGEVKGTVFLDGNPLEGALVYLLTAFTHKERRTDRLGGFAFAEVPPGRVDLEAYRYPSSRGTGSVFIGKRTLELPPRGSLRAAFRFRTGPGVLFGSVTCNGKPVNPCRLRIEPSVPEPGGSVCIRTECTGGAFRVGGLVPGRYSVEIDAPRHVVERVEVKAGGPTRLDLVLDAGGADLAGSILLPGGRSMTEARVYLFRPGTGAFRPGAPPPSPTAAQGLVAVLPLSREGNFRGEHLPPGTYDLAAVLIGHGVVKKVAVQQVTLVAGETAQVTLDLRE